MERKGERDEKGWVVGGREEGGRGKRKERSFHYSLEGSG